MSGTIPDRGGNERRNWTMNTKRIRCFVGIMDVRALTKYNRIL